MKQVILFLFIIFSTYVGAQDILVNDNVFILKDSCINFYPTDNDQLSSPFIFKAYRKTQGTKGVFTIDSLQPFMASYCTNTGATGIDSVIYKMCTFGNVCYEATIYFNIENISQNTKWIGDYNRDGVVNALDILLVTNAYKNKGSKTYHKNGLSATAENWGDYLWGIDHKYIDGNGDGIISDADIDVVSNKMFSQRANFKRSFDIYPYTSNFSIELNCKIRNKTIQKGDTLYIDISFGDSMNLNLIERNVTGIAYTIKMNEENAILFKNAKTWMNIDNNWISRNSIYSIAKSFKDPSKLAYDVVISRIGHTSNDKNLQSNCNGLRLQLTSTDKLTNFDYANIYSSVIGGTPPYNYSWNNGFSLPNISGINQLFPVNHDLVVLDQKGCTVGTGVSLIDKSNNGNGHIGTLIVVIEDDIIQLKDDAKRNLEFLLEKVYMVDDELPEFINVNSHSCFLKAPAATIVEDKIESTLFRYSKSNQNSLSIDMNENILINSIEIFNAIGQKVTHFETINSNNYSFKTDKFSNGIYSIKINTVNQSYTIKTNF
jgi:hypothetical protein